MLYAYFGGLGADKQAVYELVLEQSGPEYILTAHLRGGKLAPGAPGLQVLRGVLQLMTGTGGSRVLYRGPKERRALLVLLQAACEANLAALGQRYCYVLPSVPARPGSLAALLPAQLRFDGTLPVHPQLWQAGRPLDTLPVDRHPLVCREAHAARAERGAEGHPSPQQGGR